MAEDTAEKRQDPEKRRYTYADYLTWPDDVRCELIDGRIVDISPAPTRKHQRVLGAIFLQVGPQLEGHRCEAYFAPFDVRLPKPIQSADSDDDTVYDVVQPDLVVICDPDKLDEQGCVGAPDLVVEILSPSTAFKDQTDKLSLYEKNGVPEYWVVNPERQTVQVYRIGKSGYDKAEEFRRDETLASTAVSDLSVKLELVFR